MQNKILQRKRAMRTALLVLLLSAAGMGKGYAGIIDTIGNIVYEFVGPSPASPCPYPYNAAIVRGHKFGTDATGSLVIPEFVHFMGNENLALVPVARIDPDAFAGCSGLTSITLPNSLEEILYGAFYGCSGLTGNLEIPSSVLSIGAVYYSEWTGNYDPWVGAFEGCNFTSVTIKATTPPILSNEWSYYIDPFNNVPCSNLTVPCECIPVYESSEWHYHFTTIVEDCQATFTIGNLNYIINSDGTTVTVTGHVDGTAATGSLVIPESVNYQGTSYPVTTIGTLAFRDCIGLTSITIPVSVDTIGGAAFGGCSRLTTVYYNAQKAVAVGALFHYITNGNLVNCPNLTTINIGVDVQEIGANIFKGCGGVHLIVALGPTPATLVGDAFADFADNSILMVSCGNKLNYFSIWNMFDFNNILEDCGEYSVSMNGVGSGGSVTASATNAQMGQEVQLTVTPNAGMMLSSMSVCNATDPTQSIPVYPIGKAGSNYGFVMPPFGVTVNASFVAGTSVNENNDIPVSVYPSPTKGQIKIEAEDLKHITISNMLGQIIYDGNVIGNEFTYDFSIHNAGIYLIRIETANGVAVKKVYVTR